MNENKMSILSLISNSNFICLNKDLIKIFGLEEAIILGELASEYDYFSKKGQVEDGWFYSTIQNIEDSTGLSEYKQRQAIKSLVEQRIIEIEVKGLPAKRYIKINEEQVLKVWGNQFLKIKELVTEKPKGNKNNIIKINNKNNNNNIYTLIEENFGRTLSPLEYQEIAKWQDDDVTRYAIKQAVLNRVFNVKYIDRIITSTREKGKGWQKEIKPWWLGKEIKADIVSDEKADEMKKWLLDGLDD